MCNGFVIHDRTPRQQASSDKLFILCSLMFATFCHLCVRYSCIGYIPRSYTFLAVQKAEAEAFSTDKNVELRGF